MSGRHKIKDTRPKAIDTTDTKTGEDTDGHELKAGDTAQQAKGSLGQAIEKIKAAIRR